MKKLSETAWNISTNTINSIKSHPFNKELSIGNLAIDKFAYYIEQDTIYLQDFARSLAMIGARAPLKHIQNFLLFANGALIAEQEVVHSFFRQTFNFKETGKLTPATLLYTNYLLKTTSTESVEVGIASVLPCFWVYREVGASIAKNIKTDNPYLRWIETYSSSEFDKTVQEAIDIFDEVAELASDHVKNQMVDAFYKSTVFEWHFWNDSYKKVVFDELVV